MRPKSMVLLALALGCGVVASVGSIQLMDSRSNNEDPGDKQPVFVAMTDINPNDALTAQNIKMEEWPKAIVPAGALTKLEEVEGKRCRMKLYAGEPILSSKLVGADDFMGAAKDIPAGYRVAHVKIDSAAGSSNLIMPGDRVDVLVFRNTSNDLNATAARIVLQDIKVFAVDTHTETALNKNKDEQTESMTARTISLLVTPEQSLILHTAQEISGAVRLVLRNPEDDAHVNTASVTVGDIFGPELKSDRNAEKTDKDKGGIAEWLTQLKQSTSEAPATPEPPVGKQHKMTLILGSEVSQIDFPENGDLPNQPPRSASTGTSAMATPLTGPPSASTNSPPDEPESEDPPSDG